MYNDKPLAYLITFTCYGTWLHGDARGSVDREHNIYGTEFLPEDVEQEKAEFFQLKHAPVVLNSQQRETVTKAILEVCRYRKWKLYEVNVRTNHLHAVVEASDDPMKMLTDFKRYATRHLRDANLVGPEIRLWTRGGSRKYIWTPEHLENAINYVKNQ